MRGALHAQKLNVLADAEAEQGRELPLEVEPRKRSDGREPLEAEILLQMSVDVIEHFLHPRQVTAIRCVHVGSP
ncbi:MAG TPA: hypothetical protein VFB32_05570 [Rudaea sp.]|nr:hypothetical protein [Rudaea sp.]